MIGHPIGHVSSCFTPPTSRPVPVTCRGGAAHVHVCVYPHTRAVGLFDAFDGTEYACLTGLPGDHETRKLEIDFPCDPDEPRRFEARAFTIDDCGWGTYVPSSNLGYWWLGVPALGFGGLALLIGLLAALGAAAQRRKT